MPVAGLVLGLLGCQLVPSSKTSTADSKAAGTAATHHETTLRRASEGTLPPNVTITMGKGGTLLMPSPPVAAPYKESVDFDDDAGLTSESTFSWAKFSKNVIPWGVRLILGALGILFLIWVIKYLRRSSPAVDAILKTADEAVAARINQHRDNAMAATDPALIAHHNARIAALQEERVNLHKSKP